MPDDEWFAINRAMWDERVPIHVAGGFYDVDKVVGGGSSLRSFERDELGDVAGADLVHLQCHFGLDTLSWARAGARVVGLDFSEPAVEAARDLAVRAGLDAEFVSANVYDAVEALGGRTFDVVYTGIGALCWLPDYPRWARVVRDLLRPGGRLYVVEFHAASHDVLGDDDLTVTYDYFRDRVEWDEPGTYADPSAQTVHNRSVEQVPALGKVITAVAGAGLRVERLTERPTTFMARWPFLVQHGEQDWRFPDGMPRLPLSWSLLASRPAAGVATPDR
jgi:SAM-dependent methyltransferase